MGWRSALPIMLLIGSGVAFAGSAPGVTEVQRVQNEAIADPLNEDKLNAFLATLRESPRGSGAYLVEGDMPMTRGEIRGYLIQRNGSIDQDKVASKELIVNLRADNGAFDFWAPNERALTYMVDRATFRSPTEFDMTRDNLRKAAADWVAVCAQCDVSFAELSQADLDGGRRPTFRVQFDGQAGGPIAQSFFPSSAEARRVLYVYPEYFAANGFDPTGVLRHELGHVLGYRHEHIVGIPGCATEGSDWVPLTPYTPNSVMHYFCGVGGGSFDLAIRDQDARGHQCLYQTGKACPN